MKRRGRNPNANPGVKPVEKVELSEKNIKLRAILAAAFLLIGVVLIAVSVGRFFGQSNGWTEIKADPSAQMNCGGEFVFQYCLGASGMNATAEHKAVTAEYTAACVTAQKLFDCANAYDGYVNMYYLNQHPNTEITVDKVLYDAFEMLETAHSRILYGAPMYEQYKNLFFSDDAEAGKEFDVFRNPELKSFFDELSEYVNSPDEVSIKLLGDGRVMLCVSEKYLDFAEKNGITTYVDFFWTKNAFVADYIADRLVQKGYTYGNISSFDGFIRNLDTDGGEYSFNITEMNDGQRYTVGRMDYTGKISIVYLRDYPLYDLDREHYMTLDDGQIRHAYVDVADGLCKNSLDSIVSFSKDLGCAEILLQIIPTYVSDVFDASGLSDIQTDGVFSLWCVDNVIHCNSSFVTVTIYDRTDKPYTFKNEAENPT